MTETLIREDDTITPLEICPLGYKSISIPRHNQQGGGVAIVYRSTLSLTHNSTYNFQSIECSDFRLDLPSQCINLVIIYRPPNRRFQQFLNDLYDYMETTLIPQGSYSLLETLISKSTMKPIMTQQNSSTSLRALVLSTTLTLEPTAKKIHLIWSFHLNSTT